MPVELGFGVPVTNRPKGAASRSDCSIVRGRCPSRHLARTAQCYDGVAVWFVLYCALGTTCPGIAGEGGTATAVVRVESIQLETLAHITGTSPSDDEFGFGSAYSPAAGRNEPTVNVGKRLQKDIKP